MADYESLCIRLGCEIDQLREKREFQRREFEKEVDEVTTETKLKLSKIENVYATALKDRRKTIINPRIQQEPHRHRLQLQSKLACLHTVQQHTFNRFKKFVVKIKSNSWDSDRFQFATVCSTGIVIDREGSVLTCAHNFRSIIGDPKIFYYKKEHTRQKRWYVDAVVVKERFDMDLIILKPKKPRKNMKNLAKFGDFMHLSTASKVFSIYHRQKVASSCLLKGYISFSHRYMHEIKKKAVEQHDTIRFNRRLKCIQVGGFDVPRGGSGAPLFDSEGNIIGLLSFSISRQCFAIHHNTIKCFLDDYFEENCKEKQSVKKKKKNTTKWKRKDEDTRSYTKKKRRIGFRTFHLYFL